jgi:hypothetical protein
MYACALLAFPGETIAAFAEVWNDFPVFSSFLGVSGGS